MVPEAARRVVEARGLVVMLHVPRPGRIADPANIREVVELCEACPNGRVILAHIGRSYGPWFIEQAMDRLAPLPNLYYDVAALDDADSICVVLEHVPHTRLLFGTDLPFTAERGKHLCVNRQCLFLTRKQHPWSISSRGPGELRLTFMAYETVRALRRACERLRLTRTQVEDIMYCNARRLLDAAGARHEGSTR
jgi:glutamate-1-semialdehyde 2,1-aminomutase